MNHAPRKAITATAPAATAGRRAHGCEGPRRQAPAGQMTKATKTIAAQIPCTSEPPACSGFTATSMPATPAAASISLPAAAAGRRARPVNTTQPLTTRNVTVINHGSAARDSARALTGSTTELKEDGCSLAAAVQPPISSTGAATADTTPHQGTLGAG